ncbi:helix-turn-helix domain-containing protein [Candidatus Woesebacteria bacterium]|nr:helix-turn-helix domain-containing protein [Candidatus Woesebacteria bacterium]
MVNKINTKVQWHYSIQSESQRILHTAHQISQYFYQKNNFCVLPSFPKGRYIKDSLVVFPDLPYPQRFWKEAKKLNLDQPIIVDNKTVIFLRQFINEEHLYHPVETFWRQKGEQILTRLVQVIPSMQTLQSITIHPTRFGTVASFNIPTKEKPHLFVYLRIDAPLSRLVEVIISAITRPQIFALHGSWEESEILADWFIAYSFLSLFFSKEEQYTGTIASIRSTKSTRYKQQNSYLEKLGFPVKKEVLTKINDDFHIGNVRIQNLSPKELSLLSLLYEKRSLSYDEIADALYKDYDDFSLYAITKNIQRLRKKLFASGVHQNVIQTIRGYGYGLKK